MLVFEYQCKLKFLKSINHKTIAEKINYFLDSVLAKDQEFKYLYLRIPCYNRNTFSVDFT